MSESLVANLDRLVLQDGYSVEFHLATWPEPLRKGYLVIVKDEKDKLISHGTGSLLDALAEAYGGEPEPEQQQAGGE